MPGLSYEEWIRQLSLRPLPTHVAVVPDGNGRWAKQRGLPRVAGHRAGVETLKAIVRAAGDAGVGYFTVYAFSTENWKRDEEEVRGLMDLLVEFMESGIQENVEKGVRVKIIGRRTDLPARVLQAIDKTEVETANGENMTLIVAFNYGGRFEIAEAARRAARDAVLGKIAPDDIDESLFSSYLYTTGLPDPDLIIRSSGEMRVSNFLLWQGWYSELAFSQLHWPDFTAEELFSCIYEYQMRDRRFGGARK